MNFAPYMLNHMSLKGEDDIHTSHNALLFQVSKSDPLATACQIYLVTLRPTQLTQDSFLQKNQMLQNGFLISVTLRWHKASVACKNQSYKS